MTKKNLMAVVVFTFFCTIGPSTSAIAFKYTPTKALFFTYETKHGSWKACGPTQCSSFNEPSEIAAKSDVRDKYRHGDGNFLGYYGKCRIYQGDGGLTGGDNSTDWIITKLDHKCD